MATYIAERDSYAGFGSTGKYFGYFGLAAFAVWLTGWSAIHGHLPALQSEDAGGQLMLLAMEWIGGGVFALMGLAVLGSLMLSNKSRGTVAVDDLGVTRQIGERSRMLRWQEIEGFVVTPIRAGVTLIPREGRRTIVIPRFLDDYRGCVAEIKGSSAQGPDFLTAWSYWGKMSSVGRFSSGCMHFEAGIPASRRTTARVLPVVCGAYTDSQGRSSRTAGDGFWPGPYI